MITAQAVLDYIDTFAGQENEPSDVCDFVQRAAQFLHDRKTLDAWRNDDMLREFVEWAEQQPNAVTGIASLTHAQMLRVTMAFTKSTDLSVDDNQQIADALFYELATKRNA